MVNELYKSAYIQIHFNPDTKVYTSTYLPETENMSDKEWKTLMLKIVDIIVECNPRFIIDDNRERRYDYPPDVQAWTLELFVKRWNKIKIEKYVQVVPRHIIGQITSEQMKELSDTTFFPEYKTKIVDDYEEALRWIHEGNQ